MTLMTWSFFGFHPDVGEVPSKKNLAKRAKRERFFRRFPRCHYCGITLDGQNRTIDHVIPLAAGGKNWLGNLVGACKKCNNLKGQSLPKRELKGVQYAASQGTRRGGLDSPKWRDNGAFR